MFSSQRGMYEPGQVLSEADYFFFIFLNFFCRCKEIKRREIRDTTLHSGERANICSWRVGFWPLFLCLLLWNSGGMCIVPVKIRLGGFRSIRVLRGNIEKCYFGICSFVFF